MQGPRVRSLAGELRSCSQKKKKKKNRSSIITNSIKTLKMVLIQNKTTKSSKKKNKYLSPLTFLTQIVEGRHFIEWVLPRLTSGLSRSEGSWKRAGLSAWEVAEPEEAPVPEAPLPHYPSRRLI